jgi:thiol-disulfide isomerase/thioredoxin/uncharacterized membrane protein YphA (DoxX/SURF4 family)
MSIVLLLARLLLAVVFFVSGLGKLLDLKGSQQAMKDFSLPTFLAAPLGILLPFAELAVVVALLIPALAWWGGLGALVLLLIFVAGISYNLTLGRKPDCNCFGVFYSAAIGKNTLIRNFVLAAVALLIVVFGPSTSEISMFAWIGTLNLAEGIGLIFGILVAITLVVETWFLLEILRQVGKLTVRLETVEAGAPSATDNAIDPDWVGLPQDEDAPAFELPDLNGEIVSLESLVAMGQPLMLIFSSPTCGPCQDLVPEIGQWIRDYSDIMKFVVISQGSAELNRLKAEEYGIAPILLQKEHEVADAFLVRGTPSAVVLRIDGSIYSPLAEGPEAIRALVAEETKPPVIEQSVPMPKVNVLGQPNETPFAVVGGPAPDVTLPDVDGNEIKLSQFLGKPTLIIFWNTGCGYCEEMMPNLKAWEARPPKGAPQLLFVTAGPASDIRKQGFRSPVMLESTFQIAQMFKVHGTPSAVLMDESGFITTNPAVGADPIMNLANSTARKYARGNPKPAAV